MTNVAKQPADVESAGPQLNLSAPHRFLVLSVAFLAWFFAGMLLSTTSLAMRSAAIELLSRIGEFDRGEFQTLSGASQKNNRDELSVADATRFGSWRSSVQRWFAFYQCAFLFGAASGGWAFGRLGDRHGRARSLGWSVLCMSSMALVAYFAQTPAQLLVAWFVVSMGIGGVWPNAVSFVAETWSEMSRPTVSGIIGTAGNVGLFAMATLATWQTVSVEHWRWMLLVGACPFVLGLLVLAFVPESPRWLATKARPAVAPTVGAATAQGVFGRGLLPLTLVGIILATIPMIGGWGSANWMIPWAGEAGEAANPPNTVLQSQVGQARALAGIVGSLAGGWIASLLGRRLAYFLVSLAALVCAQFTFWFLTPTDTAFLGWVAALGFFSGVYFGWLPLCLPELFPTQVRSTGAGVCFNFGRISTAVTVFATGALTAFFRGNYAQIGRVTSLIFAIGLIAIWLIPSTAHRQDSE